MKRAADSWASDLRHPLPLTAVAILAINDHLLKGSGVLPGWLTGKLSDFAGLFFFPLLLAAIARGSLRLLGRDLEDRRALAGAAIFATGVVFTLLKLCAPFNAWVEGVWGRNTMDATDLWALPMLPLSAAFMLRRASGSPARRALDLAAVCVAALASIATSQAQPPVPPPPPAAVAASAACASLAMTVCERSSSMTFVTVEATAAADMGACTIDVTQAIEISSAGMATPADMLPSRVVVSYGAPSTFSLSFLRPISPAEQTASASIRLELRESGVAGSTTTSINLGQACTRR